MVEGRNARNDLAVRSGARSAAITLRWPHSIVNVALRRGMDLKRRLYTQARRPGARGGSSPLP